MGSNTCGTLHSEATCPHGRTFTIYDAGLPHPPSPPTPWYPPLPVMWVVVLEPTLHPTGGGASWTIDHGRGGRGPRSA